MGDHIKPALAELIGTFTLVFIGAGAGALAGTSGGGIVGVALAHGVALMVIVYTWGAISGAHVNPAVTFAFAVAGKMAWMKTVAYWIAQLLGAVIAAYLLYYLIGDTGGLGATMGSLTSDSLRTSVVEAILTFFLVITIFGTAVAGRGGNAMGLAIGSVLVMDILMGGSLTGASMNPARTFGPALAMGDLSYLWPYVIGPLVGAGAASILYDKAFMKI